MFQFIFIFFALLGSSWGAFSPLAGDTLRIPLPNQMAYISQGMVGGVAFGTIPGWLPQNNIYQIRITGSYFYVPTIASGAGIEAVGSFLNDSTTFTSLRYRFFSRKIWLNSPNLAHYLGLALRLEDSKIAYIGNDNSKTPTDSLKIQSLLSAPFLSIELGASYKMNSWLAIPIGFSSGVSLRGISHTEVTPSLSLDLKSILPGQFSAAGVAYLNFDWQLPFPGIQKGPQYLGAVILGF